MVRSLAALSLCLLPLLSCAHGQEPSEPPLQRNVVLLMHEAGDQRDTELATVVHRIFRLEGLSLVTPQDCQTLGPRASAFAACRGDRDCQREVAASRGLVYSLDLRTLAIEPGRRQVQCNLFDHRYLVASRSFDLEEDDGAAAVRLATQVVTDLLFDLGLADPYDLDATEERLGRGPARSLSPQDDQGATP